MLIRTEQIVCQPGGVWSRLRARAGRFSRLGRSRNGWRIQDRVDPIARWERLWPARRLLAPAVIALFVAVPAPIPSAAAAPDMGAELEVFTRPGCPRCAAAERFLDDLQREQPALRIIRHDIERNPRALRRLRELADREGTQALGVPAFRIGDELLIGFLSEETTGRRIRSILEGSPPAATEDDEAVCAPDATVLCPGAESIERIALPFLGYVTTDNLGLPLFTVAVGLLDGFNPCAMWVLLFLLSLLVNVRSRMRMFVIAATFVAASGLIYFAFMAAWLNIFLLVGLSRLSQVVLGLIACAIGLLNVKDFVVAGHGVSLGIPAAAKVHLYARIRGILSAENLAGAVAGVVMLAILANTVETFGAG